MRRGIALWPLIALLAGAVLAWNGVRFLGTEQKPRTKSLDFLPSPTVARAMSLGQPTAVSKLRWIDSFAYFQLQVDSKDDRVAGADPRGGFERLYDTLISLDPLFLPFYQHAATNTGGMLRQNRVALSFLMRGLTHLPHETSLWRLASAELAVSFGWTSRNPVALDRWLAAWEAAEPDEAGRQLVRDWRRGLAFTNVEGLETLPYWLEQLAATKAGSPMGRYVEDTVRELLAFHGTIVLTRGLAPPSPGADLVELRAVAGPEWQRGRAWSPIDADGHLRPDPYGWPWFWRDGQVASSGLDRARFLKRTLGLRAAVRAEAERRGRPAQDLAEVRSWGIQLPDAPDGGTWLFVDRLPEVRWPDPPQQPWRLR